jgi:hypothetical protein
LPYFSSTCLFLKDLGRPTASLFPLLRPSKTMGFDRKMDSKPVWEASLSTLLSIPRQIQHITLDVLPGRTRSPDLAAESVRLTPREVGLSYVNAFHICPARSFPRTASPSVPLHEITVPANPREPICPRPTSARHWPTMNWRSFSSVGSKLPAAAPLLLVP